MQALYDCDAGTVDVAALEAAAALDQYETDQDEVTSKAAFLDDTQTICAIPGLLDMDLYTPILTLLSADDALLGVDRYPDDPTPGNCRLPAEAKVEDDYPYGPSDTLRGELAGGGGGGGGGAPVFGGHIVWRV